MQFSLERENGREVLVLASQQSTEKNSLKNVCQQNVNEIPDASAKRQKKENSVSSFLEEQNYPLSRDRDITQIHDVKSQQCFPLQCGFPLCIIVHTNGQFEPILSIRLCKYNMVYNVAIIRCADRKQDQEIS